MQAEAHSGQPVPRVKEEETLTSLTVPLDDIARERNAQKVEDVRVDRRRPGAHRPDPTAHELRNLVEQDAVPQGVRDLTGRVQVGELVRKGFPGDGALESWGVESLRFDRLVDPVQNTRDRGNVLRGQKTERQHTLALWEYGSQDARSA